MYEISSAVCNNITQYSELIVIYLALHDMNRDCKVTVVSTIWTKHTTNLGSILSTAKMFMPSPQSLKRLWLSPSLIFSGYRGSFPSIKQTGV